MSADALPLWADDPRMPEWSRSPKYYDALNAVDVIDVRLGTPKRTIDQRIASRKRHARIAQERAEVRAAEPREQRAARERRKREHGKLSRRVSMVKRWERELAEVSAHPFSALFIPNVTRQLQEARAELNRYLTRSLQEELQAMGTDAAGVAKP
jgi:hypothetical protein